MLRWRGMGPRIAHALLWDVESTRPFDCLRSAHMAGNSRHLTIEQLGAAVGPVGGAPGPFVLRVAN